jgi:hypothetical protein
VPKQTVVVTGANQRRQPTNVDAATFDATVEKLLAVGT